MQGDKQQSVGNGKPSASAALHPFGRQALRRRLSHLALRMRTNVALVALLTFLSVLIISAIISENEDVEFKFYAIKAWAAGDFPQFPANHHNLRWAINVPTVCWVFLFGDSPVSYLVLNYLVFSLATAGLFWLASKLTSPGIATFVLALWLLNPIVYWLAPLLMPELFGIFYLILALILLRHAYAEGSRASYALSMVAFFFMYGAKETNLFFMPGLALYELARQRYRNLAIMIGVFAVGLILETAIVDLFLRNSHIWLGRNEAVMRGPHVDEMYRIFSFYTITDIPRRWWFTGETQLDRLGYVPKALYFAFFAASAWLIWRAFSARRTAEQTVQGVLVSWQPGTHKTEFAIISLGLSFAFVTTFFIISLHPLILGQPLIDRYLWVLLVPSVLTIAVAVHIGLPAFQSALTGTDRLSVQVRRLLAWTYQRSVTPFIIGVVVVATLSRLAIDAAIVSKRRHEHAEPYTILNVNAYYRDSVRTPLMQGCTVVFATRRAAWSGLIFAFPYGFFSEPERLYRWELDGLTIRDGGRVRGRAVNDRDWIGLSEIREALGQTMDAPYALKFVGAAVPSCDRATYVGHLDVHPRDQPLQRGPSSPSP